MRTYENPTNSEEQPKKRGKGFKVAAGALATTAALGGAFAAGKNSAENIESAPVDPTKHTFEVPATGPFNTYKDDSGEVRTMPKPGEKIEVTVDEDGRFNFKNPAGEPVPVRVAGVE